jgi:hypothetical protein
VVVEKPDMGITTTVDIFQPSGSVEAAKIDPDARIPVYYYPKHTSFLTIVFTTMKFAFVNFLVDRHF